VEGGGGSCLLYHGKGCTRGYPVIKAILERQASEPGWPAVHVGEGQSPRNLIQRYITRAVGTTALSILRNVTNQ
jgi:hypothetical protein